MPVMVSAGLPILVGLALVVLSWTIMLRLIHLLVLMTWRLPFIFAAGTPPVIITSCTIVVALAVRLIHPLILILMRLTIIVSIAALSCITRLRLLKRGMILTSLICPLRSLTSVMNFPLPGTMPVFLVHRFTIKS